MTTTPCPISWLRLEQYALEELVGTAVHDVEHHLATCEACRDDLATIRADHRPMRALERSQASKGSNVVRGPWWWWSVPLAAAAAALLVLRIERPPEAHKGGELAISVVVEHGGGGSSTAAPIARDVLIEAYNRRSAGAGLPIA